MKLKRTRQCKKCPWKKSTDPRDIPNGYDVEKHKALARTIAKPGVVKISGFMRAMACHEHPDGEQVYCVGWVANQLEEGDNIQLRLALRDCENLRDVWLDGPQHERFEDTLPKAKEQIMEKPSRRLVPRWQIEALTRDEGALGLADTQTFTVSWDTEPTTDEAIDLLRTVHGQETFQIIMIYRDPLDEAR
jgi:hypothetical protein